MALRNCWYCGNAASGGRLYIHLDRLLCDNPSCWGEFVIDMTVHWGDL